MLDRVRHGLIASCQPIEGGPMDTPEIIAAVAGGASGVRIEGARNLTAVRARVPVLIIGIVKRDIIGSPVRITPRAEDIRALLAAGADIIAVDAIMRQRPESTEDFLVEIRAGGALAVADCASPEDAGRAQGLGFDLLASTLSGYVGGEIPEGPDFDLIRRMRELGAFVVADGRFNTPALAAEAAAALSSDWAGQYETVGLAVTGRVDPEGRWSALNPGTLDIPENTPLVALAEARFDAPCAALNDAQAAAWGEHLHDAGAGQDLAYLTISTGLGEGSFWAVACCAAGADSRGISGRPGAQAASRTASGAAGSPAPQPMPDIRPPPGKSSPPRPTARPGPNGCATPASTRSPASAPTSRC